jgi:hypothetical protein
VRAKSFADAAYSSNVVSLLDTLYVWSLPFNDDREDSRAIWRDGCVDEQRIRCPREPSGTCVDCARHAPRKHCFASWSGHFIVVVRALLFSHFGPDLHMHAWMWEMHRSKSIDQVVDFDSCIWYHSFITEVLC